MTIGYRQAAIGDAELLIRICNAAFYSDYLRYGVCPGYGKTKEMMEQSIREVPKYIILCDDAPVGCISCKRMKTGVYEIGCLCVVPEFQGKGIGTRAIRFVKTLHDDWEKLTLVTPVDKEENMKFYVEKCGFHTVSTEMDGGVELARLVSER